MDYTNLIKEKLYDKVRIGRLEIRENGTIFWKMKIPIKNNWRLTNWHKNLIYTMMYKPLWNIGVLDKIEEIYSKHVPLSINAPTREFWPIENYSPQTIDEDNAMINAIQGWMVNSTFLMDTEFLVEFNSISNALALLRSYICRLPGLFNIDKNSRARQIYHEFKYRENWLKVVEKSHYLGLIKRIIDDRDVLPE